MADETQQNGDGGNGEGGDNQPDPQAEALKAAADLKAKRKDFLAKQSLKAQQDAIQRGNDQQQQADSGEIDLTGVDAVTATKIREALADRTKVRGVVSDALKFGMEQGRKAKALEIASELGIDKDEVPDLITSLSSARTPEELELRAKELVLEFKSDGSLATPSVAPAGDKKKGETPEDKRTFDQGRSTSANRTSALLEKIDQIDMNDPEALTKLDALKKDVDAAQARSLARKR